MPAQTFDQRRLVDIQAERVSNISSTDYPGHYVDEDHAWSLTKFKKNLKVKVQRLSNRSIEFDIVGVDASIANAFRRIMNAEVPTVCIETVYVWNNTTVIQDEILSHRLGLVPLNVDPALMIMKKSPTDAPMDQNTIVFSIKIKCERNPKAPKGSTNPDELYINHELKSSHIVWQPAGEQEDVFTKPPAPTNPNIVLAKLRPGQEVDMEVHAVKGVGKDHAKFSPVATASYRLLPHIKITKAIAPQHADKFQKCFSPGVIKIDSRTREVSVDEHNVRKDSVSREVLRHPEFADSVELSRVRDYFLFNVESEGPYAPERILQESVMVMREKLVFIRKAAELLRDKYATDDNDVSMADI